MKELYPLAKWVKENFFLALAVGLWIDALILLLLGCGFPLP
jgi:hypothetical protein